MNKLFPKINWISFDKDNPPKDLPPDTECLIFLREKYAEEWEYSVDIATPYGKYLDNFWESNVDWDEGQDIEVLAYAQLPYAQKESELIKIETNEDHEQQIRADAIDEVLKLGMHFWGIDGEFYIKARDIYELKENK